MVRVCARLLRGNQTHCGPAASSRPWRGGAIRSNSFLSYMGCDLPLDPSAGGRRNRMARICPPTPDEASRTRKREHRSRSHLGVLAPAVFSYSRQRQLRPIVSGVLVGGDGSLHFYGVVLLVTGCKPVPIYAVAYIILLYTFSSTPHPC